MLERIYNLIFGLENYEKAKIELRFSEVRKLLASIEISELRDFEILEDIIYKIRDELRVKSSNLNKTIANPKRNLRKKDVLELIDKLNELKYSFLKKAFHLIGEKRKLKGNEVVKGVDLDVCDDFGSVVEKSKQVKEDEVCNKNNTNSTNNIISTNNTNIANNVDNLNGINNESNLDSGVEFEKDDLIVFENDKCRVSCHVGRSFYLLVKFIDDVDLIFLKRLSSIFFDETKCHGTNILCEKNRCLIVARFENDNLFSLPRVEVSLDEVFDKIKMFEENFENGREEKLGEMGDEFREGEYLDVERKKDEFEKKESLKKVEESLDSLIEKSLEKEKNYVRKREDGGGVVRIVEDDEKIEVVKDDKKKEGEIKKDFEDEKIVVERKEIKNEQKSQVEEKNEISEKVELGGGGGGGDEFLVYQDSSIKVYLNKNSQVLGELFLEAKKSFDELEESEFSYINIFSKVFSSVVFDTLGAQGTNIVYEMSSNRIRIIPRFENDGVSNLKWEAKSNTDEFLEQVRGSLLQKMASVLNGETPKNKKEKNEKSKNSLKSDDKVKDDKSLKEKAKLILEELRRIP